MTMVKPLRVLTEIRSERKQKYAIVATFNGNLRFFERSVYRHLRAHQTLVLMDAGLYEHMMGGLSSGDGPRYAGVRYSVEPVYVRGGVFHPKFILTLSDNRAHLLLGSGNLGEAGYMRNAELFSKLEATRIEGQPLDEAGFVVAETCSFLKRLADGKLVLGDGAKQIGNAVTEWAEAGTEASSAVPRSTWLLHSLTQPILDQVAEKIGNQPVESIAILGPYFDHNFALFDHVMDRFACRNVHLYAQSGVSALAIERARKWPGRADVQLHEVSFSTDDGRPRDLHAKLIVWKTPTGAYCLSGSPNFTQAALESVALPGQEAKADGRSVSLGNVEVALLRFSPQSDAFDYLLAPPLVKVRPTDWDSFQPGEPSILPRGGGRPRPLRLLTARYRGQRLILRYEAPSKSATLVEHQVWIHPIGQRAKQLPQPNVNEDTLSIPNIESDGAAVVWIEALDSASGDVMVSNKRWIAQEGLATPGETGFHIEDFEDCKELGGIEGVLEALRRARERAEDPEWLLTFLRQWDIRAILEIDYEVIPPEHPPKGPGTGWTPEFPPDKPDERNLLDTGVRTLVGLGHGDIVEEIRSDYVGKVWQGLEANDLQDFSLGFRYYVIYNNVMALILHGLLQRTAEERDKWKRRQPTQYGHFVNMTRHYLYIYELDWKKMLGQGDRTLGEIQWRDGQAAEEKVVEFLISAFLAYHIGQELCSTFEAEGYKADPPPKMPDLKKIWHSVTLYLREPAYRAKKQGELESLVELALEHYQPALETLMLKLSVASVMDQLSSLLE